MILIVCPTCACGLRVTGDPDEVYTLLGPGSSFWPDKFTCFRCTGPARGFLDTEVQLKISLDLKEVSAKEAFAAIHGLGIPAEREVDRLVVEALLREQPIKKIACADIPGGNRVTVDFLELADGTRLHFGSSNEGAVIYRITKPHRYAETTP